MKKTIVIYLPKDIDRYIIPFNKTKWIKLFLIQNLNTIIESSNNIYNFSSDFYKKIKNLSTQLKDGEKIETRLSFNINDNKEKDLYNLLKAFGSPYIRGSIIYYFLEQIIGNENYNKTEEKITEKTKPYKQTKKEHSIEDIDQIKIY